MCVCSSLALGASNLLHVAGAQYAIRDFVWLFVNGHAATVLPPSSTMAAACRVLFF